MLYVWSSTAGMQINFFGIVDFCGDQLQKIKQLTSVLSLVGHWAVAHTLVLLLFCMQ